VTQITEFQARCQTVIERNVVFDVLESQEPVQRRIEALSKYSLKPMKRLRVRYDAKPDALLEYCLGSVVESVIDPSRSSIESLKEVRQSFLNEFEIVTRNSDGKTWYAEDELIDVRIIEGNEGNLVDKEIIDEKNGKYRVRFKATKAEPYEIRVNIGGELIKNSPQNVNTLDSDAKFNPLFCFGEYGVSKGQLKIPRSIAIGDNGKIAIADCVSHRIQIFSLDGKHWREFGSKGLEGGDGELCWPFGVVFSEDRIIVSDQPGNNGRIQEFDLEGTYLRTIYKPEGFFIPRGMCVADDNNFAVCCWGNEAEDIQSSIKLFSKEGELIQEFCITGHPLHLTYSNSKYFVSFVNQSYIKVFNLKGGLLYTFRDSLKLDGHLNTAYGLSFYGENMVLVCDGDNDSVELYTKEGRFVQSFGSPGSGVGQMLYPLDVAVSANGQVFVLELDGKRVHVWK
jgi:WD40 repeat protein